MAFRENILLILMQCIDDSAVKFQPTGEDWDMVLNRLAATRMEEVNEVVRVIDSVSNGIEKMYSSEKFIEIFDNYGLGGFVN